MIDYLNIIEKYYIPGTPLYNLLVAHSRQVADYAMQLVKDKNLEIDKDFVYEAAMLHDIGIFKTHAPAIHCNGEYPYMMHAIIGADILRKENLPRHALACERHIGTGLTSQEIISQNLPLPHQDFMPQTIEEKLVCFADNFFSKSKIGPARSLVDLRYQMEKYGPQTMERLDEMIELFY